VPYVGGRGDVGPGVKHGGSCRQTTEGEELTGVFEVEICKVRYARASGRLEFTPDAATIVDGHQEPSHLRVLADDFAWRKDGNSLEQRAPTLLVVIRERNRQPTDAPHMPDGHFSQRTSSKQDDWRVPESSIRHCIGCMVLQQSRLFANIAQFIE
jgi:hypothetical protein